ncbi:glycosyltransferase family 4 protein [Patescibacteria group bacterium]|nr:glycosyltransferase family 4 protein [Patescibacteria group bacterium]
MNIGIDVRTLMDKYYSGVSTYSFNLVQELLKLDKENNYFLYYNSAKKIKLPELSGEYKIIDTKYPNKIFNYILQKIFSWPKIDRIIGGVDIFLAPHYNFTSLSTNTKKILTIHDLSFLRYPNFFSKRKNFWHKAINIKKLARSMDIIVAVSENTKQDVVELLGVNKERVKVVYSGLESNFIELNNSTVSVDSEIINKRNREVKEKYKLPDKYILSLCNLEPRKNIETLILAYNKLRDDNFNKNNDIDNLKLVICGAKSWKYKNIFKTIKESKYRDDIIYTSYIENIDKPYIYKQAQVFVYPSFYEGFGFPPLEAMACSVPVVASFSSSLPEIIDKAGILVDPKSSDELSKAIENILLDKRLKDYYIEKGLKRVKEFSWQSTAKSYIEIFKDLEYEK